MGTRWNVSRHTSSARRASMRPCFFPWDLTIKEISAAFNCNPFFLRRIYFWTISQDKKQYFCFYFYLMMLLFRMIFKILLTNLNIIFLACSNILVCYNILTCYSIFSHKILLGIFENIINDIDKFIILIESTLRLKSWYYEQ